MTSRGTPVDPTVLLRAGVEAWREAVVLFAPDRTIVYANAAARRLFSEDIEGLSPGRRAERWLFRDAIGRLMPADASPSGRALRGEVVEAMPCELVFPDGSRRHLRVDAYPLRADGDVVTGVMCVVREAAGVARPRPRLFEGQASWLAQAARGRHPDPRLTLLADAGRALGASLDLSATLEALAGAVVPTLADWCVIRVIEADGSVRRLRTVFAEKRLEPAAQAMEEYYATRTEPTMHASPGGGLGRVLRTGEPLLVPHVSPTWLRGVALDAQHFALLTRIGIASLMHAPLLLRGRTIGVLTLVRCDTRAGYGVADLALAEELCDRAAVAIENARLFEASERRGNEAHALAAVARVLAETLDPEQVWRRIADGVRTLLDDAPAAALYARDASGDMRTLAVSTEPGVKFDWTEHLPAGTGMVGIAVRDRAIVTTPDALADLRVTYPPDARARLENSAHRALLAVPLVVQDRVFGALAVGAARGRQFTEGDIELVSAFADQAAVALHNARLFAEARYRRAEAERAQATAEAANRAKDEFLAVLSHELRTPLTAILGWVRLLRGGRLPAERVLEALAAIDRNTHVQTRLIDELLDVSRIVAGKVELEVEPVDFAAVVAGVVASTRQDPRAAAVLREPVIGADVFAVLGDPVRLQQIVSNLVSNAVKFTPPDGRVEVTLRQVEAEVELVVSDTGVGLSPDELPHIFDRFHQVDRSNTRRHGGLGLGLAIVRHLVLMHRGQVRAESAGRHLGARFTVRLPCAVAVDRIPVARAAVVTAGGERPLSGVRVLFVDDNIEARSLVGAILEAAGAAVVLAASAAEALAALAVTPVDVVLSDIGMPDVDGYDFVAAVRAREGVEGRDPVPAIAVTAYATSEDRRRAVTRGFQAHVPKPIDPADLVRVVVAAVRPAPGAPRAG